MGYDLHGIQFYLTREEVQPIITCPPIVPVRKYWKSATYRGWVDKAKCINQPDNKEDRWQAGKLFSARSAKLMNQWDKEEKSQERLDHQISLIRCTPINPMNRTLGFHLTDAGHTVVPPNSCPPTVENRSQEYPSSWEKGRVLQGFQVIYISEGKGEGNPHRVD